MNRRIYIVLSLVLTSLFINQVSAEKYVYNMTQDEIEQSNLVELCYVMQSDLTIVALEEFCKVSYGDIDSVYGDKINATTEED